MSKKIQNGGGELTKNISIKFFTIIFTILFIKIIMLFYKYKYNNYNTFTNIIIIIQIQIRSN